MTSLPSFLSIDALPALEQRDIDTLRHMLQEGMGENSLRAIASDLSYIESWHRASDPVGDDPAWPPSIETLLRFVSHHLFDHGQRERDPEHGMPVDVEIELRHLGVLRSALPHSPATVRRRFSSWKTLCIWRGVSVDAFESPGFRKILSASIRSQPRIRARKSKQPIGLDDVLEIVEKLSHWCVHPDKELPKYKARCLSALRDRAILGVGFASGGRRRSEISNLRMSMIEIEDIPCDPCDPGQSTPQAMLHLGRTKTRGAYEDQLAVMTGPPVFWLQDWIRIAGITSGSVFRRIDSWGNVGPHALAPESINRILKARLEEIGRDPSLYSAHGLRSGFITDALGQGIPIAEVMAQTGHRSMKQAISYFQATEQKRSRSSRLIE